VVGLSTNGHRLRELAPALRTAGVTAVNVSVDSLDPARFGAITGSPRLGEVLEGVEAALAAGISPVKLNAVLLRGMNDEDIDGLIDWTRGSPVDVRFIELMRTGRNAELFEKRHVSGGELRLRLLRAGWRERARGPADGPAVAYGNPAHVGRVGIIAPYSEGFCANCNRLRVSSIGGLRLCLFGKGDHSLRPWLSDAGRRDELIAEIRRLIAAKPERHHLKEGDYGNTWNLAATGG
jgi:cyclic pyranopterin phosphate synthase